MSFGSRTPEGIAGRPAPRRKLPIGIQTFRTIREGGYYYVDKTDTIRRMVEEGSRYFLSRPRRFGKSLLVDTLRALFEGHEELFRGLAIHDHWDWRRPAPVVKLDFAGGGFSSTDRLRQTVSDLIEDAAERAGVRARYPDSAASRLRALLTGLHAKHGRRVVVLVDEYDAPILDTLHTPEVARSNRDFLASLYGVLKACDAHVRFVLLTGVTKFAKVNLFSRLNYLEDLTLDPRFATICGPTDQEVDQVFAPELPGLDRDAVREWYGGYRWLGEPVYNPHELLMLFRRREFVPYWFEAGTPRFMPQLLAGREMATFGTEDRLADDTLLSSFDVDQIEPEALLFQTGYLTVRLLGDVAGERVYSLQIPNRDARESLSRSFPASPQRT